MGSGHDDPFTAYADEPHIEGGVHHPYTAFNQGWDARDMGATATRNPYTADTREEHWWLMGWNDCDDDKRQPDPQEPPSMSAPARRRATPSTEASSE